MTQRKFMQYNSGQDDLVGIMPVDKFENGRVAVALAGGAMGADYVEIHRELGKSEVAVFRSVNYDLKEEIALYNALRKMEIRNPSLSRIQDKFRLNTSNPCEVGLVVGRDFESNQPIFYENRVLDSDSRFKAYLDDKLGSGIVQRPAALRAVWIGTPELEYMGVDSGRIVGVVPERR